MNGNVHNYYETRVFDELDRQIAELQIKVSEDQFDDMACIALNQLPSRYVRYDIDTTFYATPEEIQKMRLAVKSAVSMAINKILA